MNYACDECKDTLKSSSSRRVHLGDKHRYCSRNLYDQYKTNNDILSQQHRSQPKRIKVVHSCALIVLALLRSLDFKV